MMKYNAKSNYLLQMRNYINLSIILIFIKFSTVSAIIGYDCSQQVSNLTTFSLIHVGECDITEPMVNTTKVYIRLLQLNDFASTQVKLCKVEIKRTVKYCGAFSHRKDMNRGEVQFLNEVSREECIHMHRYRTHKVREELITLRTNSTTVYPMTFVGKVDHQGNCDNAGSYSDPYGTFDNAVVTGYVKITLQDYYAPVNLNSNEIVLKSGTRCELNKDTCIDIEAGYAFWEPLPATRCEQNKFSQLYAGYVNKIIEYGNEKVPVYVMESSEVTFAFATTGMLTMCAHELIRTEHPKLFFIEGPVTDSFETLKNPTVQNLDIFAYVNSKFVYVEKHIKGQLKRLYHDLIVQKCELEKRVISNALSIASSAPDVFAYQITKKSGYMGVVAGEVVHLMKCVQVDVQRREAPACYQELPVTKDGKNYFLTPRTHILKQHGTETTCNLLIPPMFLLGDDWFTVLPRGTTKGIRPTILKPSTTTNWNYTDPAELAKSGIYTQSEIQALRQHLMFPIERPAVLNSIALGMTGKGMDRSGLSIARLFDEEALNEIASNTGKKIWAQLMTFGSFSAAMIGIIMIGRLFKFLIDTIIHGYALYSLYGWSIHIIGSIWNSVTQLLLHIGRDKPTRSQEKTLQNQEEITRALNSSKETNEPPENLPGTAQGDSTVINIGREGHLIRQPQQLYPSLFNENRGITMPLPGCPKKE